MSGWFLTVVLGLIGTGPIRVGTHAYFISSFAVTSQKMYFEIIKDYSMTEIRNFFLEKEER